MKPDKELARRLAALTPEKRGQLQQLLSKSRPAELVRRDPQARVPLAYGQERLWILHDITSEAAAYNETNSLRFPIEVNTEVFKRAIDEIVRRHEILRTRFEIDDGEPLQKVSAPSSVNVPVIDLRHLPQHDRPSTALRFSVEQSRKPFDVAHGPLLRCALYRLDAQDFLFVLTMHHLICDGWSMGVFMVELMALYWSFLGNKPSPLSELPVQYGDYALWQRQSSTGTHTQLKYWKTQLKDLPLLDLPADHPRPAEFSFRGARLPITIEQPTVEAAAAIAAKENATLFMVVFAAFTALLHRYTDQDDIVVGTPSSGRTHQALEPLIGFFINTVILRVSTSGDPTFLELVRRVRETATTAFANQDIPFEKIVEELQPPRDKSRNPFFQVTFQLFSKPGAAGLSREALLPFMPVDCGISKFDLSVDLIADEGRVHGNIEYNRDLFEAQRIQRMADHFLRLLGKALANPSMHMSELPLTSTDEEQALSEWGQNRSPYPRESTITELLLEVVQAKSSDVAIQYKDVTLNYITLWERARSVADMLRADGVHAGDRILVPMDRGPEFVVSILGVLLAGAAYVPVDPAYPEERIAHIAKDCGARMTVRMSSDRDPVATYNDAFEGGKPSDIAYLMYTSGTTGPPKGVAVTHQNIVRLVRGVKYVSLTPDQRVLQVAPVSFDASTFEIWGALLNGGTLEVYPPGVPVLEELGAFIREKAISVMFLTTALFRQLVNTRSADLRGVKQILVGGEEMFPDDAQTAWTRLPQSKILNVYGPTECTTFSTAFPLGSPENNGSRVPIGKPIENTETYICDRYGRRRPIGIPGELCIGGDGVAIGYWCADELTNEKFVPNPFRPGERMYRTWDLACVRSDGNILFLGRRDRQLKISGYRIEIGEVEAAIALNPAVRAVTVVATGTKDKRLDAYCELHDGHTLKISSLREFLFRSLPHYMIPSGLVVVDRMPLTTNGKVDLAALSQIIPSMARSCIAPRNDIEKTIAAMWSELLGRENPGVTDDFFQVGGHSLIATRLISRIRAHFNKAISMRDFFENPTIEGLAQRVSQDVLHQVTSVARVD